MLFGMLMGLVIGITVAMIFSYNYPEIFNSVVVEMANEISRLEDKIEELQNK